MSTLVSYHQPSAHSGQQLATRAEALLTSHLLAQGEHVHARSGGIPVLVTAESAAQIKAHRQERP
jgi:hypothetical protein